MYVCAGTKRLGEVRLSPAGRGRWAVLAVLDVLAALDFAVQYALAATPLPLVIDIPLPLLDFLKVLLYSPKTLNPSNLQFFPPSLYALSGPITLICAL